MKEKLPGIKAKHVIVTPECRANKGLGALDEALDRLGTAYKGLYDHVANGDARFHFVLTVEVPARRV